MWESYIDWLPLARPQPRTRPATQECALIRNQTSDLSVCRLELNPLSHTSQGRPLIFTYGLRARGYCWAAKGEEERKRDCFSGSRAEE